MQVSGAVSPDEVLVAQATDLGDERHPWGDAVAVGVKPGRLGEFRACPEVYLPCDLASPPDCCVFDPDWEGQSEGQPLIQSSPRRIPDPGIADGCGEHQTVLLGFSVGVVPVKVFVGRFGLALVIREVPSVWSDAPDYGCRRVAVYRVRARPSRAP